MIHLYALDLAHESGSLVMHSRVSLKEEYSDEAEALIRQTI